MNEQEYDADDIKILGDDAADFECAGKDEYQQITAERKARRCKREQAEDTKEKVELDYIQPRKERRFKLYMKYEGRRGPLLHLKTRLPTTGAYEDGPSKYIKRLFLKQYNMHRVLLSEHSVHLRSDLGVAIPDEDAISGYIGFGGLVYIVDGSAPFKSPENLVYSWGKTTFSAAEGDIPTMMLTMQRKRIKSISVGIEHAIAVTEGGRTYTWGKNDFGQLGTGDEVDRLLPMMTELSYEVFINDAVCGGRFTMGWTKSGDLYTWGRFQASNFPRQFTNTWCNGYEKNDEMGIKGKKVLMAAAGDMHMAVVTRDFQLFTWGYNDYGQLGWGLHGVDRTGQQKPKRLMGLLEDEEVIGVACGGAHTMCWTKSGEAFGWGSNIIGQIGKGLRQIHAEPDAVPLPFKVTRIAAGWQCSILIGEGGESMVCGGLGAEGPKIFEPQEEGAHEEEKTTCPKNGCMQGAGSVMDLVSGGAALMQYKLAQASVGEAHALVTTKEDDIIGWGYNRQAQAVGYFTDDTAAKMEKVVIGHAAAAHLTPVSIAVGGSQSYALLRPKQ